MKKSINKYKLIIFTGIITLLLVTLGVSYSIFSYVKQGEKESSITTGSITFIYTENDNVGNGIVLTDSFPISDEEGKSLTGEEKVFDFKVQANLSRSDIEYEIVAEPTSESNIPLDAIKFYLTEVSNDTETEISNSINLDSTVKTLKDYEDTTIENATGKTIYQETILRNTKGYIKNFRARMWLNDSIEFDENYINKSGSIRITVYANTDRSLASNTTTTPSDVSIERVTANNKYLFTASNSSEYQYELTVPSDVDTLSIDVFPSNTNATYTVEKIEKIRALSLTESYTITKGDNYFKVTVISSDTKSSKDYILKVTREYSNNTNLASLTVENYNLTPSYSNNVDEYSLIVPSDVTSINITATKTEDTQTITGTGTVELTQVINEFNVIVTAENGSKRTIKITVERGMNSDASINNVGITGYNLVRYQDNIYYIEVENNVTSITINNISTTNATVIGTGEKVNLQVGNNDYQVKVISQDQKNINDYVIRIIRKADTDNTLKSLSLTNCEIAFNRETTDYTCTVENSITSTTVTAESTSSIATVTGTGEYSLDVGTNTIEVVVKAQNGLTKTYTVTINRKASSDATLKLLEVENQTLTPTFDKDRLSYTLTVPYGVDSVLINAEATSNEATVEGIGTKELIVDENTFTIKVTAQDGTTRSYQIIITRLEDKDTSLKSISVENHNLVKVDENHYTLTVDNSVTSVVVNAEATSSVAEITSGIGTKDLVVGDNKVYVIVTSQSGETEAYEIIITRLPNNDATLKSLSVSGYNISPAFEKETTSYTLTVPYSVTSLTVNAEVNNSEASIEISGNTNLQVGSNNKVNIIVTAEDKTKKTYTITVTREQDTINTLKSLSLTNCEIGFNSETTDYTCTVENSITSTTVTAEATSSVATVTGTGEYSLDVGTNTIEVIVKAQNGTTKTYTVIINRKASSDATLKSLEVENQTLTPAFEKETTSYTLTVPYSIDSVVINAEATSSVASVEGTGSKTLDLGDNTFTVKVTAEDGTPKSYQIIITRLEDTDTSLKSISVENHNIVKVDENHYTLTVDNSVTSVVVNAEATSSVAEITSGTGTKELVVGDNKVYVIVTSQSGDTEVYEIVITRLPSSDATLKSLSVEGYTISPTFASNIISYTLTVPYTTTSLTVNAEKNNSEASVTGTGNKSLNVGSNAINVVVTAGDGTTKTYTITVTRSKDTTATLSALSIGNCTLNPAFNKDTTLYTCTVENSVTSTNVTATATSSVATVTGTGTKTLNVGSNEINVVVTAQDGTTKKTYKVTVTRKPSSDATLKSLSVSGYNISPTFESGTTEYTLTVPYSVSSITVNATATSSVATVTGTGTKELKVGSNEVNVVVTAQDGTTKKTYKVTVTRQPDTTTTLSELSVGNCTLNPTFASGTTSYTCTVENSVTSTNVTATATSNVATVTGTGTKTLSVGANTINVIVTAQSGATKTYTVTVTRKASSDATLKSLSVSNNNISPTFNKDTTAYTLTVPYSVTSITVNAEKNNSEASVTGTGSKSLSVGSNKIEVVVTAGDKTTKKTYTITVTRSKDTTATLSALSVGNCTLNPAFNKDTTAYTCTVENSVTSTNVTATATSSVATITGTGNYNLSVGTNTINVVVTAQNGTTKKTYKVTVTRKASNDATLSALSVSGYSISPTFASVTTSYTLTVPYSVTSLTVNATKNNAEASVAISGNTNLQVGSNNKVNVVVTAGDKTTKTYTITVTRQKDSTSTLKSLSVSGYSISPTFASGTTSYSVTVEATSIVINAETTSGVATVTGTGTKTLSWGTNTFSIIVTAQSGATKTYTLTVNNNRPVAPVLTGGTGSSTWTNKNTTISVATAGTAISNVKNYEYYTTTSTTTPSDSTTATGTTSNTVTISTEGTTYVYYRTVSNNGNKSTWSSPQVVNLDTTGPTAEFASFASQGTSQLKLNFNINDSLSGYDSSLTTLKYSDTEGVYTQNYSYYAGFYALDNLKSNTTYYYQLCVYDKVGNKTCITGSASTTILGLPYIAFTNTPSTSQNGYLKKQTAVISFTSGNAPTYYYVKTTRAATSSKTTTYSCGTGTVPGTCSSIGSTASLSVNTWYRFSSSPTITYDQTATSTAIIYAATGDGTNLTETTSGTVSKIDATQPYITYNSDSYSSLNSTLSKVEIYYNMGDDHSGLANYTCEFKGDGTFSSDTSISSSGTSISSSGTSISSSGTSTSSSTGDAISTSTCTTSAAVTTSFSKGVYDYIGYKICATDKVGNTTKCITGTVSTTVACEYEAGQTWTFDYTGSSKEFTIPCSGVYKLETWGASGGYAYDSTRSTGNGGYGGYSIGNYVAESSNKLYITVGGEGESNCQTTNCAGGYNGGSSSTKWAGGDGTGLYTGGGGGATHIATTSGLLYTLKDSSDSVLLVSGGGGGGDYFPSWSNQATGGSGGGYIGNNAITSSDLADIANTGGTQTSGYTFGAAGTTMTSDSTGGSGGGWYGGISSTVHASGAGGSGYIGNNSLISFGEIIKHMTCYKCNNVSNVFNIMTQTTNNASESPISDYAKIGDGYAKITLVSLEKPENYEAIVSTSTYTATASTVNCGRWKTPYGTHYIHQCETCGQQLANSPHASISATPGAYCSSHFGTYHTKTTYSCPNGGTLNGTTCTITTHCPNGGTLNESTNMCEF